MIFSKDYVEREREYERESRQQAMKTGRRGVHDKHAMKDKKKQRKMKIKNKRRA